MISRMSNKRGIAGECIGLHIHVRLRQTECGRAMSDDLIKRGQPTAARSTCTKTKRSNTGPALWELQSETCGGRRKGRQLCRRSAKGTGCSRETASLFASSLRRRWTAGLAPHSHTGSPEQNPVDSFCPAVTVASPKCHGPLQGLGGSGFSSNKSRNSDNCLAFSPHARAGPRP
jgi:hypothetical protein